MRFTECFQQEEGPSCQRWRNGSHSKGKGCREGHGQDQDKAAAEEGRKQRGPEGSIRNWSDCTETGNRGLGGRDWPGGGWSQELLGFDWSVVAPTEGRHSPGSSAAQKTQRRGQKGWGTGLSRERQVLAMEEAKKPLQAGARWRKRRGKQRSILELDMRLISTPRKDWAIFPWAHH